VLKDQVDIVLGQLHSEAFNPFMELMHLDAFIVILIKEQECFCQTLEFLLNLNCDQGHDLAQVSSVIFRPQLFEKILFALGFIPFVGAHDVVQVLRLIFVSLDLDREELVSV
jgi:hypothetical protein